MSKTVSSLAIPIIRSIIISIICIFTVFVAASAYAEQQQGQDVITIIPGASDKNNPSFFDVTYYPIQVGKEVKWYNADDINHKIIISNGNETNEASIENKKVVESGDIKPNTSFSYKFDKEGTYRFSYPTYPWMHGNVIVSNDISTTAVTNNLNNSVAIQLSWYPAKPKAVLGEAEGQGQQTHFIISLLMKNQTKFKSI